MSATQLIIVSIALDIFGASSIIKGVIIGPNEGYAFAVLGILVFGVTEHLRLTAIRMKTTGTWR